MVDQECTNCISYFPNNRSGGDPLDDDEGDDVLSGEENVLSGEENVLSGEENVLSGEDRTNDSFIVSDNDEVEYESQSSNEVMDDEDSNEKRRSRQLVISSDDEDD